MIPLLGRWRLRRRILRNVALVEIHKLAGYERLAACFLFSIVGELEEIGVVTASRGDCIPGQLEDELSHRETFFALADALGGRKEPDGAVVELVAYLKGLDGIESIAGLNVVGEAWLEQVFKSIEAAGFCSELFSVLTKEEARHTEEALKLDPPDPGAFEPILRDLELRLCNVAKSPSFLIPLTHLIGLENAARMGLDQIAGHERACAHLGLLPGPKIDQLREACETALRRATTPPKPWAMNPCEISLATMTYTGAMENDVDVPVSERASPAELEALTVWIIGRILSRFPRLNRTLRRGQMYLPDKIAVTVVRAWDQAGRLLSPVCVDNPQRMSPNEIRSEIRAELEKLRSKVYEEIPPCGAARSAANQELRELLPASQSSVVVSQTGAQGGRLPAAPIMLEAGHAISVCLGKPRIQPRWNAREFEPRLEMRVAVRFDHRAGAGHELGCFVEELEKEFEIAMEEN